MSSYPPAEPPRAYMGDSNGSPEYNEKGYEYGEKSTSPGATSHDYEVQEGGQRPLHRDLKSRHMQMIAIGGAIGAGLFIGSGKALHTGGPASLVIGFIIIGFMLLFTMQSLAELGVMYPVNGAFFQYAVRFIEPCWGFACGWDYAIQWLTILPFEITAASITLSYWKRAADQNIGVWITVFLVALCVIQFFGVRGYGEVEFVLSIIKIIACTGFIILGIIIDCGGVPTDDRGYIGARYWHEPGAFVGGFAGFCSVFVTASFAFGGTELTGLAAAEAANPLKSIPQATKQVFWRITFFYVVALFIVGLIVPSDADVLLGASGANSKASPFVYAIQLAGIKGLPSVFNAVITISVLSVANSCAFGSTRTLQALAAQGMAPKFFSYVDKKGRPLPCIILQLVFGLLAFANEASENGETFFDWLLALSGLANFFIWGSICISHIRFRKAWKYHGHTLDELPYKATFGVWGSSIGIFLNVICLMASFYTSVSSLDAYDFFQGYLAAFVILGLYLFWKVWTRQWRLLTPLREIDVLQGMRTNIGELREIAEDKRENTTWKGAPLRVVRGLF